MTIPHALFRFEGQQIDMNERQFTQAIADGKLCGCGQCLACRALEYARDRAPYPFCRTPERCAGRGTCPRDPCCAE